MYYFLAMDKAISASGQKKAPSGVFVATAILLFFCSLSAADSIGFVPYYVDGTNPGDSTRQVTVEDGLALSDLPRLGELISSFASDDSEDTQAGVTVVEVPETPVKPDRIIAPDISLDLSIQNPETRDIAQLDELLKTGPARFVDSALLGQKGNVLIFAHSSRLPVVRNQMYKAFNRVSELEPGQTITLTGGGKEYLYSVTKVRRVDAEEEIIDLSAKGNRLTLVTCDTLTSKSSRFVVEAELVGRL
jgi:LPXTG-site transpeptidase (sortase) family protein